MKATNEQQRIATEAIARGIEMALDAKQTPSADALKALAESTAAALAAGIQKLNKSI